MTTQEKPLYAFGPFQLDTNAHTLMPDGHPVPLEPKIFDLLAVLVENSGRVVSKGELMNDVWVDSFVEDSNLPVSICKLRKALGEVHGERQYIETVPRRGYRFVARVHEAGEASVQLDRGDPTAEIMSNGAAGWAN